MANNIGASRREKKKGLNSSRDKHVRHETQGGGGRRTCHTFDPGSELRLGGRAERKTKKMNGKEGKNGQQAGGLPLLLFHPHSPVYRHLIRFVLVVHLDVLVNPEYPMADPRRSMIEVYPKLSEAPHLRSSIPPPKIDSSKNRNASRRIILWIESTKLFFRDQD